MRRVAFCLYAKEFLTVHDLYLLSNISARLKNYLNSKQFLSAYRELKNAVRVFTGKKFVTIYHVLNLQKFYDAFGFNAAKAPEKNLNRDAAKLLEDLICYYSVALKISPLDFALNTPLNVLLTLQKTVRQSYVDRWRNMLYSYHAPQSFKEYLDELINTVENLDDNETYVDRIAKALARSPNLNKKSEPHWANTEVFLKSRYLQ